MKAKKNRSGWTKRTPKAADADPIAVLDDLGRRRLDDMEACREAWEHTLNPVAVCWAVQLSDAPEWLKLATLAMMAHPAENIRKKIWRDYELDVRDRVRAYHVAYARAHAAGQEASVPVPWEAASEIANYATGRKVGMEPLSLRGMRGAFDRVAGRLKSEPWRYYNVWSGLNHRLAEAHYYLLDLIEGLIRK